MFSFLNGLILPALFAASIPIILHFLSRKKARRMPFSSTKFLKIIENQRIKRVKLYQFLLILVRTLFIIFLVLAFARPTINTLIDNVSGNAQTTAVILLDDSYSMQAFESSQTFIELANQNLQKILSVFKPSDKVFLISSSIKTPFIINTSNKKNLLNKLKASNNSLDLSTLLAAADSIFTQNINLNNELYFLSDFRITEDNRIVDYKFKNINNLKAYTIDLVKDVTFKNVSIDSIELNNQLIEVEKPVNISVYLTNHDANNKAETNLNLYNNDVRSGMSFVSFEPSQSLKKEIQYTPQQTGPNYLKLQIDQDDLSADNNFYFSLFIKETITVLFVNNELSSETSLALSVLEQNSLFQVEEKLYNEWLGLNLNSYDLIVLNNLDNNDQPLINKLNSFISNGKSLVVIPGEKLSLSDYNTFLKNLGSKSRLSRMNSTKKTNFFSLESEKTSNTIFDALFRDKKSSFSPPKIYKYLEQRGFDEALINLSNKNTFLSKSGPIYFFGSSFSGKWTDFETNGLFIPLLYRTFYLAANTKTPLTGSFIIGDKIVFRSDGRNIENSFFINAPDKETFAVIPIAKDNNLLFNGGIADRPGFYMLIENKSIIGSIAVNHSPEELKKPFLTKNSFGFEFISLNQIPISQQIMSARTGFELWLIFLVLAFTMLIIEMIIIKRIEGLPLFSLR